MQDRGATGIDFYVYSGGGGGGQQKDSIKGDGWGTQDQVAMRDPR